MFRSCSLLALAVLSLAGLVHAQGPEIKDAAKDPGKDEQKLLRDLGLGTDGKSLLDYLRKQTFPAADPKQMEQLIRDLGDDLFTTREAASRKLMEVGKGAIVGLKQAEKDGDYEIRRRAEDLRKKLEAKVEPAIQCATVRLVAQQKPEGSAEVLLAFLPFAADLSVTDEVCKSLALVVKTDKGVDPAVIASLDDKLPIKRAAAAEALVRAKVADQLPAVRKLLKDPEPIVRVRTGVALVEVRDPSSLGDAVPVLIESLKHLPPENLWAVEDILVRLAGDGNVPAASLGATQETREQCFKLWDDWYAKNRKDLTLAKLDAGEVMLGHTLMVYQSINRNPAIGMPRRMTGEVCEIDMNKKALWKLTLDDSYPVDAMVLPDRPTEVAIAEYSKARVTIRETKTNKIVWTRELGQGSNPIGVQALRDGKIVIVLQNRVLEVDRNTNQEKVLLNRVNHDVFRARKTRNGDLVYVTNGGTVTRVDSKGTTLKTFQVSPISVLFGNIDVLPNGNVLVPDYQQARVVEYDMNGGQVSMINTPSPSSAMRLPNGNTLVASQNTRRVSEFNRAGQVVWSHDAEGQVFNARRR